jgi:hypothetical protein
VITCARCDVELIPTEHGWTDATGQQQVADGHRHYAYERADSDEQALALALLEDPWSNQAPGSPLSDQEKEAYDLLINAPNGATALIRTTFQGRGVAVVCGIVPAGTTEDGGDTTLMPLAMILDTTALAEMEPPT